MDKELQQHEGPTNLAKYSIFPTYKKRSGTNDVGKEFEYMMCAFYALKLSLNNDILDFEMTTNNKEYGDFDDIGLEITFTDRTSEIFLLQLKHKENKEKRFTQTHLASPPPNDFSLIKYLNSFEKVVTENVTCVVYTNSKFNLKNNSSFEIKSETKKQKKGNVTGVKADQDENSEECSVINVVVQEVTSATNIGIIINNKVEEKKNGGNIFQFEMSETGQKFKKFRQFSKQFYLLAEQCDVNDVKSSIRTLLSMTLEQDIYQSFEHFMKNWWQQNFVLNKTDIICKLVELTLSPWIQIISRSKRNRRSKLLKQAIMNFEMTVLTGPDDIVKNIWMDPKKYCPKRNMSEKQEPNFIDLVRFTGRKYFPGNSSLTDQERSKLLWYMDQVPLVVQADSVNQKQISNVVALLKKETSKGKIKKKIVLVGHVDKKDFSEWKMFTNLLDLSKCNEELYNKIVNTFGVSLQGRKRILLKQLVVLEDISVSEDIGDSEDIRDSEDISDSKDISVSELLEMTQRKFNFAGKPKTELPVSYIQRTVSTTLINTQEMFRLLTTIEKYVIIINCSENLENKFSIRNATVMEISKFLIEDNLPHFQNLILFSLDKQCSFLEFNEVCVKFEKTYNDVYLMQMNENFSTLLFKKGNKLPLEVLKCDGLTIEEAKIFDYCNNRFNVFCAPPGMGKSTLFSYLRRICPPDYWCLHIRLINHNPFFRTRPPEEQIFERFMKQEYLSSVRGKKFCKTEKMYVFLDGLDEVDSVSFDLLINFTKWMLSKGSFVWISCRENLRDKITKTLNMITVDINELTNEEQNNYIQKRLKTDYESEEIKIITEAIFTSPKVMIGKKYLLAIPLQLYIITEIFCNEPKHYKMLLEEDIFVLTKMYQVFFDGKKKFLHQKVGLQDQEEQIGYSFKHHLRQYEIPALKNTLDEEDFKKLKIDEGESLEYVERIKLVGDKFGIINHVSEENQVAFNHHTYAEYFACLWLKQHLKKVRKLQKNMFSEKYDNLKIIFDIMMAEAHPLHLAVIYQNVEQFEKHFEDYDTKDDAGRKPLHLACSYGMKYPTLDKGLDNFNYDEYRLERESIFYVKIVENLLMYCKNIFETDNLFHFNYIHYASESRCLFILEEMMKISLAEFKDLEAYVFDNFDFETLTFHSAEMGYRNLFSGLLQKNPNLARHEKFSKISLLRIAVTGSRNDSYTIPREGNIGIVNILVKNGELINEIDIYKRTVLDYACKNGCYDMLEELIGYGATCTGRNTLIHSSSKYGILTESIMELSKNVEIDAVNQEGKTALHLACENNHTNSVEKLLQQADPNKTDMDKMNALHFASKSKADNVYLIDLLLKKMNDINSKNQRGATALHLACNSGNIKVVQHLVSKGSDITAEDNSGKNALHYAADSREKNIHIINFLIDKGVGINSKNNNGMTPLQIACTQLQVSNVGMLLDKGADPNSVDDNNMNSLHHATKTWSANTEIMLLLLKKGVDVNARTKFGKTALHIASEEGVTENVKILLQNHIDVNICCDEKMNALHYAAKAWKINLEIVNLLIAYSTNLNARNENGTTVLQLAFEKGHIDIAKSLLQRNVDTNSVDKNNMNTLHYAVISQIGDVGIIRKLVEQGTDVNAQNRKGQTPLHFAFKKGQIEIAEILINYRADGKIKDNKGRSVSHYAIKSPYERCGLIRILVRYGLSLDAADDKGLTALHMGCHIGDLDAVSILLEFGVQLNVVDNTKKSSLHYAAVFRESNKSNTELIRRLLIEGIHPNTADAENTTVLSILCHRGQFENVKILLEYGADVNIVDKNGMSALHFSTQYWKDNTTVINLLLNRGLNPDVKDKNGRTSLQLSCKEGHLSDVKCLIDKGSDLYHVDKENMNAFHYAAQYQEENTEIMNILINKGVEINTPNIYGEQPLHLSCKSGNLDNVNNLLTSGAQVNRITSSGRNILHYAALSKNSQLVEKILHLEREFNIDSGDKKGTTAIHIVCKSGDLDSLRILIDSSANLYAKDNKGRTVLHYAVLSQTPNIELIKCLLAFRVDDTTQDYRGRNVVEYAIHKKCYGSIKILIETSIFRKTIKVTDSRFLYYSVYCGSHYGVKLCEEKKENFDELDIENEIFPFDFVTKNGVLNWNLVNGLTKFVCKFIEYSNISVEENHPNVEYSPQRIAAYFRNQNSSDKQLAVIFEEADDNIVFGKRFLKIQKFLKKMY